MKNTLPTVSFLIACCAFAAEPAKKADPCCEALANAPFAKNSIYQAEVAFTDDAGRVFKLGELRGRPVVLTMFFASCGYACPLTVTDMQAIRAKLPTALRERAAFVLVSFDSARDTPAGGQMSRHIAMSEPRFSWMATAFSGVSSSSAPSMCERKVAAWSVILRDWARL